MSDSLSTSAPMPDHARVVAAGEDRFGERRGLGVSFIDFKVTSQGGGGLLVLENTFHAEGRPCAAPAL